MSIAMLSSSQRRFPLLLAASAASGFIGGLLGALIAVQLLWPRRLDDKLEGEEDAAARNRLSGGAILSPTAVAREALPGRIILLRHGESEGNADKTLYRTKPDNLIELTAAGSAQAREAGARLRHQEPRVLARPHRAAQERGRRRLTVKTGDVYAKSQKLPSVG